MTANDLHTKGSNAETEFTRRVDIRNGRSVVDDLQELQSLLASENLASGTSSKVVLNSVTSQINHLM